MEFMTTHPVVTAGALGALLLILALSPDSIGAPGPGPPASIDHGHGPPAVELASPRPEASPSFSPEGPLLPAYLVTFSETGLPQGELWSVELNGSWAYSTSTAITFMESDGIYQFALGWFACLSANPASGSVVVDGAAAYESIGYWFHLCEVGGGPPYQATFTEQGLTSGRDWSMVLAGGWAASASQTDPTDDAVAFWGILNGTYAYSVGVVPGFVPSSASGSLTINGSNRTQTIDFKAVSETGLPPTPGSVAPPKILGLPLAEGYTLIIGIISAMVVVPSAVIVWRCRRRGPSSQVEIPA
jgi:hypothetical protein